MRWTEDRRGGPSVAVVGGVGVAGLLPAMVVALMGGEVPAPSGTQAYVIAHEVGHHVQKQLGIERQLRKAQQGLAPAQSNQLSVRMELQADCLAGVWTHQTEQQRRTLQSGDLEEALMPAAASATTPCNVRAAGRCAPIASPTARRPSDSDGLPLACVAGNMKSCDTFSARQL